jgi:peptide-methionine (S)-S-oxide reductase
MSVYDLSKIALGGGCHWCTEAVFQSLQGVKKVEQGFVASTGQYNTFSEAVIVHFDTRKICLGELMEIHLHTHRSTSDHSMRPKYRSAVYTFSRAQTLLAVQILEELGSEFGNKIITKVLPIRQFQPSKKEFLNYYYKNPEKPFCRNHILPKLMELKKTIADKIEN